MSKIKTGTTLTTAYQVEGDTTGALVIQTGSTPTTAVTIGSDQSTTLAGTLNLASQNMTPYTGFKNRIINGAMIIDQRNNGTAVTNASAYIVDRWGDFNAGSGRHTAQQVSTAPTGFSKSLLHTVTTTATPLSTDTYQIFQVIEGNNAADLAWGTANAQAVTLSFWVRSSVAGTYAVSIKNGGGRSYVATYTINASNTFEYKTVTIQGDTGGTWATDNSAWGFVCFDLGSGSNQNTTAGSWQAGDYRRTSGCVNWMSNAGATFYITGVQLEKGSTATSFDYRPYGTELQLCERYLQRVYGTGMTIAANTGDLMCPFRTLMRTSSPTYSIISGSTAAQVNRPAYSFSISSGFYTGNDMVGFRATTTDPGITAGVVFFTLGACVLVSAEL